MLLQPTETPSRAGINNAITTEIANHASLTNQASLHYDSGWQDIPLIAAGGTGTAKWRVRNGVVGLLFNTTGANIPSGPTATPITNAGALPVIARPGPVGVYAIGNGGGSVLTQFVVGTDGRIHMLAQAATTFVRGNFTYLPA